MRIKHVSFFSLQKQKFTPAMTAVINIWAFSCRHKRLFWSIFLPIKLQWGIFSDKFCFQSSWERCVTSFTWCDLRSSEPPQAAKPILGFSKPGKIPVKCRALIRDFRGEKRFIYLVFKPCLTSRSILQILIWSLTIPSRLMENLV